jgi:Tfp pilus assembly protein FimT
MILAVSGILLGITLPSLSSALDRIEVESAVNHMVAAHQRARLLAITHNQVITLTLEADSFTIHKRAPARRLWSEGGPSTRGVQLAGPVRQFTFSPEGFTLGLSNATLRLTRGSASRTVVISRLGRIRIER